MSAPEDLESLSTKALHDRAFSRARRHLDVGFFWRLLEAAPAAEAAAGHVEEAEADVLSFAQRVEDAINPDSPEEAEAFRPIYLEYLREHEKKD
ncbi:MAG: hypothetical protein ACRDH9_06755 [Actinomycetota bacterium]